MKNQEQKPFWHDMRNPITMQKVTRHEYYDKTAYNKQYYKKNLK